MIDPQQYIYRQDLLWISIDDDYDDGFSNDNMLQTKKRIPTNIMQNGGGKTACT